MRRIITVVNSYVSCGIPPPAFVWVSSVFVLLPSVVVSAANAKGVSVVSIHNAKNAAKSFRVMVMFLLVFR